MAGRISDLVNSALTEEGEHTQLATSEILDLIDLGRSEGGSEGRHWVLDPIDGTRGFVGQRQYAICLGMLHQGQAVVGVLACPNLPHIALVDADGAAGASSRSSEEAVGCLFAAQKGSGAFVGPLRGGREAYQKLSLEDLKDVSQARFMESFESGHSDQGFTARLAKKLGVTKPPLRLDSQAKYGALARGDAAINLRFPHKGYREKIWDHVAGVVICTEAGATVSDASGAGGRARRRGVCGRPGWLAFNNHSALNASGNSLDFSRGRWLDFDRGIVTSTPTVHNALLEAVREIDEEDRN